MKTFKIMIQIGPENRQEFTELLLVWGKRYLQQNLAVGCEEHSPWNAWSIGGLKEETVRRTVERNGGKDQSGGL